MQIHFEILFVPGVTSISLALVGLTVMLLVRTNIAASLASICHSLVIHIFTRKSDGRFQPFAVEL